MISNNLGSPLFRTQGRDEHWTRLGLEWIRSGNLFKIQEPDRIWTELMEKKCGIYVVKRLHFSNCLDFI